jgi:hypothetical protein
MTLDVPLLSYLNASGLACPMTCILTRPRVIFVYVTTQKHYIVLGSRKDSGKELTDETHKSTHSLRKRMTRHMTRRLVTNWQNFIFLSQLYTKEEENLNIKNILT